MDLLIVFIALEILAVLTVVALCMAARRGDEKTARALAGAEPQPASAVAGDATATPVAARARLTIGRRLSTRWRTRRRDKYSD